MKHETEIAVATCALIGALIWLAYHHAQTIAPTQDTIPAPPQIATTATALNPVGALTPYTFANFPSIPAYSLGAPSIVGPTDNAGNGPACTLCNSTGNTQVPVSQPNQFTAGTQFDFPQITSFIVDGAFGGAG